jgi:hypothetical protein
MLFFLSIYWWGMVMYFLGATTIGNYRSSLYPTAKNKGSMIKKRKLTYDEAESYTKHLRDDRRIPIPESNETITMSELIDNLLELLKEGKINAFWVDGKNDVAWQIVER